MGPLWSCCLSLSLSLVQGCSDGIQLAAIVGIFHEAGSREARPPRPCRHLDLACPLKARGLGGA